MRSRETRGEVSRQINLVDFQLECLEHQRTCPFIVHLGVTVRSKRSTVMMERFIVDHFN